MIKQRHQLFVVLLGALDALVIILACLAAAALRVRLTVGSFDAVPLDPRSILRDSLLLFALPLGIYACYAAGLYKPFRDRSLISESTQVLKACALTTVGLVVALWALGSQWLTHADARATIQGITLDAPRIQVASLAIILTASLTLHRAAFRLALRTLRARGRNLRHVVIIGTGRLGQIACRTLERNSWTGIHVSFFIDHRDAIDGPKSCVGRRVLGGLNDLESVLEVHSPDAVYIALPNARAAAIPSLLRRLERFVVDVRLIPDVHPRYLPQSMTISELEGMPILSVRECPLQGLGGAAKRVFDALGSAAALILFSPLMLITAAAVALSSPGPIIFRQRRVSLGGHEFDIFKFRTMEHVADESGSPASWTKRDDPRITRLGRFLRRTSLDELPQLFNVLRGDMSLVGPRPERPELIAKFRDDWRGYMLRQHVKAGITGWAQVNGLRGDTSLKKRLQYDLVYIRHWSLGFDLKILWLTLFRGFIHRNAH